MRTDPRVVPTTWRGHPAVRLSAGEVVAVFLPSCGMLGVSVTHRGDELLAFPHRSLDRYRAGELTGLPLMHPWANRLGARVYRHGRTSVDLRGLALPTDPHGLPIHGTLHGQPFDLVAMRAGARRARLRTRLDFGGRPDLLASFPFPHRVEVDVALDESRLRVTTAVVPTARRAVPVSFGWHPYLRLPGALRADWTLRMPRRRHRILGVHLLPTGVTEVEPADDRPIGRRTFDDHYSLGRDRLFALIGGGRRVSVQFGSGYPHAQVYVPPGRGFACIEPMTAPVNSLVDGTAPTVRRGDRFSASFAIHVT